MADYRYIRRAFLGSRRIKVLTWMQECFFVRLMLIADDYGLFEADPAVLRATLFPQHLDKVAETDIEDCLEACHRADLLLLYENTGHQYGMILRYKQRCQGSPKLPLPPGYVINKVGKEYFLEPSTGNTVITGITETHGNHGNHGEKQTSTETHGNHGLYTHGSGSEHGHEISSSFANAQEEESECVNVNESRRRVEVANVFACWLDALKQAHPSCRRSRKLASSITKAAKDAFDRMPEAHKEADLLASFLASDADDGFFRPLNPETFFNRLEATIENAHRWNRKRIALAPEGFVEWLTPLMNAHPALRKATALSEEVCRAALSAYKRLQDAQEHADMLAAYYESRITQDKRRKDYFRPLDGVVYFDKLESVLTNAEAWARFAEWKHPGTTAAKSSTQDTPETPRLSEEEIKTYFAELRKNIEHPQPL